jgi:hypothetical protein
MDDALVTHDVGIEQDREQILLLMRESLGAELLMSLHDTQRCLEIFNQTDYPHVAISHEGAHYAG